MFAGAHEPATAAQEVAHVTFNPTPLGLSSPLAAVCDDYERNEIEHMLDVWRIFS